VFMHEGPAAGLVVSVVDPHPGETIVDCCAAPGGKTLFMASRLFGQGKKCRFQVCLFLNQANYIDLFATTISYFLLCLRCI
jgi:16S rRNA C967 or C1407 C5-methylase (RsmB/RsmF family)